MTRHESDSTAGAVDTGLEAWHRLHPLSPLVRGGKALVVLVVLAVPRLLTGHRDQAGLIVDAAVAGVAVAAGVVSWLVTRWQVDGPDLRIETGLLRRSSRRYPLRQVQAIDVVETGLARLVGLAELRLRMAGGGSNQGRLACLPVEEARALREQLLVLRQRGSTDAPAPTEPGGVLVLRVSTGQLLSSLLLSGSGIVAVLYLAAVVVSATTSPGTAAALLGSGGAVLLGFGTVLWRRFNGEYHQTVHRSDHGLQLASGLVQTSTESLPYGRVQALRMVEPLLWRPFGWCRVEAAVAGKGTRQEDRSEGARRRALLPVGTYAQAYEVLGLVLDDLAVSPTPPPARARWKSPLSYHRLSVGGNARCVVTTSGRLRRVSHWVPLDKVQSIRRTEGPVQRRLHLATVHLDTAGPRMHAALRDRDRAEADAEIARLPALCATARVAATAPSPEI
ncbi:MAG TPA: PH domain-containing protein [Mycobacteriales bacterium]